jgi:hypothetical protein
MKDARNVFDRPSPHSFFWRCGPWSYEAAFTFGTNGRDVKCSWSPDAN